jgi:hypothetical protein
VQSTFTSGLTTLGMSGITSLMEKSGRNKKPKRQNGSWEKRINSQSGRR